MKILIDGRFYGLENAGLGRYVINLIEELKNLDTKNSYVVLLKSRYFKSVNLPPNWQKVECNIRHYTAGEQIFLPKIIKKYSPDLVHFPHFNVPIIYNGSFVVTIHDMLMHRSNGLSTTTLPFFLYGLKRAGYKKVFASSVFNSKKIIVPSEVVKSEISKFYKLPSNKITVTYEGVDKNIKSLTQKNDFIFENLKINDPYFLYVGNAYPHKNLKRLVEAVLDVNRTKRVLLIIVSARSVFRKRLEKLIPSSSSDIIKIVDFLNDSDLAFLMKNSLAFVYPSLSEGFGLPALEAMSCGTLAAVSEIPVFKEIYKNNAIYFNPYDFSQISGALLDIYNMDLKERKKRVLEAKEFIKKYSWRKMAEETLKVYEEAV